MLSLIPLSCLGGSGHGCHRLMEVDQLFKDEQMRWITSFTHASASLEHMTLFLLSRVQ